MRVSPSSQQLDYLDRLGALRRPPFPPSGAGASTRPVSAGRLRRRPAGWIARWRELEVILRRLWRQLLRMYGAVSKVVRLLAGRFLLMLVLVGIGESATGQDLQFSELLPVQQLRLPLLHLVQVEPPPGAKTSLEESLAEVALSSDQDGAQIEEPRANRQRRSMVTSRCRRPGRRREL